jgi:ABC-type nitrate/sulfonate/bicarbonate transport system substrate-binding protein
MITRKEFLAKGAGGIAAAGFLGALGEPAFAAAHRLAATGTKATFQLGWIANVENMGEFVAVSKGYYVAEGLDLNLVPGGPGVSVEPLVASGKALVGLSSADYTARARLSGAKLRIVGATLQKNPSAVMSLAKNPIRRPHDLVGKKLGLQQTSYATYNAFFKANGIDPKTITYVPVQYDPAPLVSGQVDAFASFQTNQPIALAQKGIKTTTFLLADYGYNTFADAFVVSEKTLADPVARETVKKILRATIHGWQDALKSPAAAAKVVVSGPGKSLGLKLHDQTLTANAEVPLVQTAATHKHGLLWMDSAGIAVNMASMKRIGITIKASDLFSNELLREIYHGRNHV